jgi:hypothetical protein
MGPRDVEDFFSRTDLPEINQTLQLRMRRGEEGFDCDVIFEKTTQH